MSGHADEALNTGGGYRLKGESTTSREVQERRKAEEDEEKERRDRERKRKGGD